MLRPLFASAAAAARPASAALCSSGRLAASAAPSLSAAPRLFSRSISSSSSPHSDGGAALSAAAASAAPPATARPVSTRRYTNPTLRRLALAQTKPWYMSASQFRKYKLGGFDGVVQTKLPFELRQHKAEFWMRRLRKHEAERLQSDPQRLVPEFGAGDKIVVTKYLSLHDRTKFERIGGLCLARQRGDRLSASFLMRSHKLGEDYELRFPLYSPFIARIDVLETNKDAGRHFRQKMYYLRERERALWLVRPPALPKPTVEPMSVARVVRESEGKVMQMNVHPMKRQLKTKRAGGIGAELAAADKGGKKR